MPRYKFMEHFTQLCRVLSDNMVWPVKFKGVRLNQVDIFSEAQLTSIVFIL